MDNVCVNEKIGYQDVFGQKEYLKLLIANLISRFGDSIDAIAFTWIVYQVTGSASWSAIIFAMNRLPSILVQPFAGAWVEGRNKKRIMVGADLIRGVSVVMLAVLLYTNRVNVGILLMFTLIISSVEAFCLPATTAAIPKIIDMKYYEYASSLNQSLSTVVQLAGMAAAGTIIAIFGVGAAVLVDGVTFFLSSFMITLVRIKEKDLKKEKNNSSAYFENLKDGVKYLKEQPVIRNFCLIAVAANGIIAPINSLEGPMVKELFGQGAEFMSIFGIALTVGVGLGALVFPMLNQKIKVRPLVVMSGIAVGAGVFLMTLGPLVQEAYWEIFLLVVIASFLIGAGSGVLSSALNVQLMKKVEPDYLARTVAIFGAGGSAAEPVVSFLTGFLALYFSVGQIFAACAILCVLLFLWIEIKKVRVE